MASENQKPYRSLQQQLADLSASSGLPSGEMTPEMDALAGRIIRESRDPVPGDSVEISAARDDGIHRWVVIVAKWELDEESAWINLLTDSRGNVWELTPGLDSVEVLEHEDPRHPLYKASDD